MVKQEKVTRPSRPASGRDALTTFSTLSWHDFLRTTLIFYKNILIIKLYELLYNSCFKLVNINMTRGCYLINNPFFDGLRHKSIEITDKTCGSKEKDLVYLLTNSCNEMTKHSNHVPLNQKETLAYYAGRTIRFPISVIGTIVDGLLQLFICFTITIEYAVFKGVTWLKNDLNPSQKMKIIKRISFFSRLLGYIQLSTTRQEPIFLAKDLRLIPDCKLSYDLSERLIKYLYQTSFGFKQ